MMERMRETGKWHTKRGQSTTPSSAAAGPHIPPSSPHTSSSAPAASATLSRTPEPEVRGQRSKYTVQSATCPPTHPALGVQLLQLCHLVIIEPPLLTQHLLILLPLRHKGILLLGRPLNHGPLQLLQLGFVLLKVVNTSHMTVT